MTEFYGLPNAQEFWHWANALHFVLVGLAGGMAFLAALLHLKASEDARRYTLFALGLIALDLFVLWAESPARFRFTHVWLFLSFHPGSPIGWGAWSLALAFASALLLYLGKGPRRFLAWVLLLLSLVVLAYPGMALAVNANRPLWNALLAGLFPVTALTLALGLATLLQSPWAPYPFRLVAGLSLFLAFLYPLTLSPEAQAHFLEEGGVLYGLLLLVGLGAFARGNLAP
jgi:formate-dependent nitrite reductase membrane component NrfD